MTALPRRSRASRQRRAIDHDGPTTARASELIETTGPMRVIVAPFPLLMMTPVSLTTVVAPPAAWRTPPPPLGDAGASLNASVF
jgi:hypothetical protein